MKQLLSKLGIILLGLNISSIALSQDIKSPADYLGYPLGAHFTYHHNVVAYFDYVASESNKVLLYQYGQTYERRALTVAYISSPENIKNIEEIRKNNLRKTGLLHGAHQDTDITIVWLSYNVHGNEANSTETSMKVLYELVNGKDKRYEKWLEKIVIILDPCLNPDGRDRYVNWYNQVSGKDANLNINTREHQESWMHGRSNHYLFDLNRDWVWQTQIESEQRLKLYNEWLPQVHVDFHEQFYNSQYYFAPAAQPMHELITDWQKEFQEIAGKSNASRFDEKGWLYFTEETFDLLYPGYGDSYPTFNGAIGMTYEMPGHGNAGLAIKTAKGDTLTLAKRIDMHFTTSMATLESCYTNRVSLLEEFTKYFNRKPEGDSYYVLKSKMEDKITQLTELLDKNKIRYNATVSAKSVKAFSYADDKVINTTISPEDLIIPLNQPKSTLVQVLFERNTKLTDSLTYDITAWSLPYVYDLEAFQVEGEIPVSVYQFKKNVTEKPDQVPYAYLINWTSITDAKFLSAILNADIRVNFATKKFKYDGMDFNAGTLIITRIDNENTNPKYLDALLKTANSFNRNLIPITSGAAISTMDIGSQKVNYLKKPKVAMLAGEGVSTRNFGELWHFFEQEIAYPIDIINKQTMRKIDLGNYDILVLASGRYENLQKEEGFKSVDNWVKKGGILILIENAINGFIGEEKFELEKFESDKNDNSHSSVVLYPFHDSERENLKKYIRGGIIRVEIDNTHPLAFGYAKQYFTLKDNGNYFKFLPDGWNVGYISSEDNVIAGYIGSESKEKLGKNLVFGVEHRENGKVIYFADNPIFRAFWQNGKLFLANAIFFNN